LTKIVLGWAISQNAGLLVHLYYYWKSSNNMVCKFFTHKFKIKRTKGFKFRVIFNFKKIKINKIYKMILHCELEVKPIWTIIVLNGWHYKRLNILGPPTQGLASLILFRYDKIIRLDIRDIRFHLFALQNIMLTRSSLPFKQWLHRITLGL